MYKCVSGTGKDEASGGKIHFQVLTYLYRTLDSEHNNENVV